MRAGVKQNLPYLYCEPDHRGNKRIYVRRHGRRIRLKHAPGSVEFMRAYTEAVDALNAREGVVDPKSGSKAIPGTLGWLAACYMASKEFTKLDGQSQVTRRGIIDECLLEPLKPGSRDVMAGVPLNVFSAVHLQVLRDRKESLPGAANNRLKYFSAMLGWAVERKPPLIRSNPARDVKKFRYSSDGFHTWTLEEIVAFENHWPIGSKPRLAFALMLYLGVRPGDARVLGRQHYSAADSVIKMVPHKTQHLRMDISEKVVSPELAEIIAKTPTGDLAFLVSAFKRPFTEKGFTQWFSKRCTDAGLPHCTGHGLRKALATIAADSGATDRQLMAQFDWSSSAMATRYTQKANKKKLAKEVADMGASALRDARKVNTDLSHGFVSPKKAVDKQ